MAAILIVVVVLGVFAGLMQMAGNSFNRAVATGAFEAKNAGKVTDGCLVPLLFAFMSFSERFGRRPCADAFAGRTLPDRNTSEGKEAFWRACLDVYGEAGRPLPVSVGCGALAEDTLFASEFDEPAGLLRMRYNSNLDGSVRMADAAMSKMLATACLAFNGLNDLSMCYRPVAADYLSAFLGVGTVMTVGAEVVREDVCNGVRLRFRKVCDVNPAEMAFATLLAGWLAGRQDLETSPGVEGAVARTAFKQAKKAFEKMRKKGGDATPEQWLALEAKACEQRDRTGDASTLDFLRLRSRSSEWGFGEVFSWCGRRVHSQLEQRLAICRS